MKISELLQETPLPDDWDKAIYSNQISFNKRVQYAKARAARIGSGSGRIAFEIEYEGRPTILKIGKNKKGIAQNDYEAGIFRDYYANDMGIFIPMIDYDEENDLPTWIHTEKAEKINTAQFRKFFNGLDAKQLIELVKYMTGKWGIRVSPETEEQYQQIFDDNEIVSSLVEFVGNYDIQPEDFSRLANWGIYKNQPVIIDVGASTDVISQHYS